MIFVEFMLIVGCFGLLFVGLLFELFCFCMGGRPKKDGIGPS